MNIPKILHFVFVAIVTLLVGRLFSMTSHNVSSLNFPILWVVCAAIGFTTVYFPFTSKSLDFYQLPLKTKIWKFSKKALIIDVVLGILSLIPFAVIFLPGGSESAIGLLPGIIWIALLFIFSIQIATVFFIAIIHPLEKIPAVFKYPIFIGIVLILIFLNSNAHLIPGSEASWRKNEYFASTGRCEELSIYYAGAKWSENGCSNFNFFDESGVKPGHHRVAPINAFRKCEILEPIPGQKFAMTSQIVDCKTHAGQPGVDIRYEGVYDIVPRKYMDQYGFKEDDSYFEVCKTILTDYVNKQKQQCSLENRSWFDTTF